MTFQSLARQRVGVSGDSVESSRRSLAQESHLQDPIRDRWKKRQKGATNSATVIAESLQWTAQVRKSAPLKRILVVEPRTRNIGMALRATGLSGETTALMHTHLPREFGIAQGYDHCLTYDWISQLGESAPLASERASAPESLGQYDAVIVNDLTRVLSPSRLSGALTLLASHLSPMGYLVVAEPAHVIDSLQLMRDLVPSGLELLMDPEIVADDWPRLLMTWRRRPTNEAMRIGVTQCIDWPRLAHDRVLQGQLIAAYREVFGDDEWFEWVKCTRPGCGRYYSFSQAMALQPPDRCICGWDEPMIPFHSAEDILASLYHDLTPSESTRAYFRFVDADKPGEDLMLGGFAWGYLTDPYRLSRLLIPVTPGDPNAAARDRMLQNVHTLLHQAHGRDNPSVIYYHSILGAVKQVRSLSLTRHLFERGLQFAREHGARVFALRTSVRSEVYPMLIGVGMRPVYWYAGEPQPDRWHEMRAKAKAGAHLESGELGRPFPIDERVVLSGEIATLLDIFATHSDTRLAGRMAQGLRAARNESR